MRLLLVHGRSQGGLDPVKLKSTWRESLDNGLERNGLKLPADVAVDFPYYADLLDSFAAKFDLPLGPNIAAKGGAVDTDYARFRAEMAEELQVKAGISDAAVQAEMGPGATDKGIQNWKWVQALIRLLDNKSPGVTGWSIEEFMRDVYLYTQRPAVRDAINEVVVEMLKDDTAIIVGHSLGSIVVYDILSGSAKPKVPMLVTVGSPLAIRPVRKSLGPLKNPSGAKGWYNAYDPADVVALYPLDAANFDVSPSITNYGNVHNWTENHHGIIGYLSDAEVAKTIHSAF
jgi:hypothetical protein